MIRDFDALTWEYDQLLLKQEKSDADHEEIDRIERVVLSRFGYHLSFECWTEEL
jgi:hypothetical protein